MYTKKFWREWPRFVNAHNPLKKHQSSHLLLFFLRRISNLKTPKPNREILLLDLWITQKQWRENQSQRGCQTPFLLLPCSKPPFLSLSLSLIMFVRFLQFTTPYFSFFFFIFGFLLLRVKWLFCYILRLKYYRSNIDWSRWSPIDWGVDRDVPTAQILNNFFSFFIHGILCKDAKCVYRHL